MSNVEKTSKVKILRSKLGLTQAEFANEVKISTNTVSNIEAPDSTISIETAKLIAERYKVSLDWLYGLSAEESTNLLDSFCAFFSLEEKPLFVDGRDVSADHKLFTAKLSSLVTDYIAKKSEIERINKEKDLPKAAYKAWLDSVKDDYLKELNDNGPGEMTEYVLIENKERFGEDVACTIARNYLPDMSSKKAFDKINSNNA